MGWLICAWYNALEGSDCQSSQMALRLGPDRIGTFRGDASPYLPVRRSE